jgi:hypothetical protein
MQRRRRQLLTTLPFLGCLSHRRVAAQSPRDAVLEVVAGTRAAPQLLDMAALQAMPSRRIKTRTPWHEGEPVFAGPLLRTVLAAAQVSANALRLYALNDYWVDIPADDAHKLDVIVATSIDSQPISVRDKGPLFVMYPFDSQPQLRNAVYFSRCIWQLRRIEAR